MQGIAKIVGTANHTMMVGTIVTTKEKVLTPMSGTSVVNKVLHITPKCYEAIVKTIASTTPECGGILGMKKDAVVCEYVFDKGIENSTEYYIPDINTLNKALIEWSNKNVQFYGMIHSHLLGRNKLSSSDIDYGRQILTSMNMDSIYMLLVDTDTVHHNLSVFELKMDSCKKIQYNIVEN